MIGPLFAVALMQMFDSDFRAVFWFALIPAWGAVAVLVFGVREPSAAPARASKPRMTLIGNWRALPVPFWALMAVVACFGFARYGEAFLILAAEEGGLSPG